MRKFLVGSASVLVTIGALPVSAQTDAGASGLELEEIVVTATKRETNLQKVSIAIEVYSAETLKKEGKKRIDEIMSGTAGVQVSDGPQGATYYMRGINGTPFFNDTGGTSPGLSTVAVMVDGVVQARNEAVRGGTLDMAQAEVLRGPQSTTVGANSLVGAVALVSNQPVFDYQTSGSVEFGNYNLTAYDGVINVPLTSNQAFRFAASTNKRDGYASSGAGDSDLANARVKYRWQVNDDINLVGTFEHQFIGGNGVTQGTTTYQGSWEPYNPAKGYCSANTQLGTAAKTVNCYDQVIGFPFAYGHLNPATDPTTYTQRANPWNDGLPANPWGDGPYYKTRIDTYSVNLSWNLGFGTLTALPSYQKIRNEDVEPLVDANSAYVHLLQHQTFKQLDLRLASNAGGKLDWLAGLYYSDNNRTGPADGIFAPGAGGMGTVFDGSSCPYQYVGTPSAPTLTGSLNPAGQWCHQWTNTAVGSAKESSVYGNLTFSALDNLRLVGALRYTRDVKEFLASLQTLAIQGVGASLGPSIPYSYTNFYDLTTGMGTASTLYNSTSGGAGKGTWSKTTYRAGVEYDVLPEAMAYATYSTGYQAGDVSSAMGMGQPNLPYACDSGANTNANCTLPLLLKQITLGFKSRWFDKKLQANVELFDTRYTNQQQPVTGFALTAAPYTIPTTAPGGGCNIQPSQPYYATNGAYTCITDNAATLEVKSRGVDLDVNYLPTADDRIDLTAEWLSSKYSAAKSNPSTAAQLTGAGLAAGLVASLQTAVAANAASFDGLQQQNAPSQSYNVSYSHSFRMGKGGTLTPKFNWVHKSDYWTAGFPTGTISATNTQLAYSLYNAYLNWEASDGRFNVSGYVRNIGEKPVLLNQSGRPGTANAISLDAPRTYGVVFAANF